jgi:hypothetical protein
MRLLYKFVSNFIGQPNEDKIIILDGRKDKHLFDDFNPDNLEKRFGGRAPDLVYCGENSLFPPRMPTDNIFFPNENANDILITEEEYIDRCKKGLIPQQSISPYIQDKLNEKEELKVIEIKSNKNSDNNSIKRNPENLILNHNNLYKKKSIQKDLNQNRLIKSNENTNYSSNRTTNIAYQRKTYIKHFMYSSDWKIDEEIIGQQIYKKMSTYQFLDEIKNFSSKKEQFRKNLLKIK